MKNHILYYIENSLRERLLLDCQKLEGIVIRSIDEYLLYFPTTKKLVYEYLKKTTEPVKLSYLHNLFVDQSYNKWTESIEIQSDPIAKRVVEKLVYDPYTWKYGIRDFQHITFDSKYLLLNDSRLEARKCVDYFYSCGNTHQISQHTTLRGFKTKHIHDEYFSKRHEITKNFFENVILKDVHFQNTAKVNYMFDFVEVYDEISGMTFRHDVKMDMDNSMKLIFKSKDSNRKKSTAKHSSLFKFGRRHPAFWTMIDNISERSNEILAYHNSLLDLKKSYESTVKQSILTIKTILEDFAEQRNYLDFSKLGMIMVHPNSVESNWFRMNKDSKRFSLYKSTYYPNSKRSTEDDKDWSRITTRSQSYNLRTDSYEKIAEYLFDLGMMNVFYWNAEPEITEYYLLSQGKLDHRYSMLFCMSPLKQSLLVAEDYLNFQKEIKVRYENSINAGIELDHTLPQDKNQNKEEFKSYIEYFYSKKWPYVFANERKNVKKSMTKNINKIVRANKEILELDKNI